MDYYQHFGVMCQRKTLHQAGIVFFFFNIKIKGNNYLTNNIDDETKQRV